MREWNHLLYQKPTELDDLLEYCHDQQEKGQPDDVGKVREFASRWTNMEEDRSQDASAPGEAQDEEQVVAQPKGKGKQGGVGKPKGKGKEKQIAPTAEEEVKEAARIAKEVAQEATKKAKELEKKAKELEKEKEKKEKELDKERERKRKEMSRLIQNNIERRQKRTEKEAKAAERAAEMLLDKELQNMRAERQKAEKEAAKKSKGASGSAKPDTCIVNPPCDSCLAQGVDCHVPVGPRKSCTLCSERKKGCSLVKRGGTGNIVDRLQNEAIEFLIRDRHGGMEDQGNDGLGKLIRVSTLLL